MEISILFLNPSLTYFSRADVADVDQRELEVSAARKKLRRHRGTNSVAAIKRMKLSNDEKNSITTVSTFSDENTNTAVSTSSDKDKEAIAC